MLTFKLKSQNNHLADSPFELIIEHLPPCCQVKVRLDLDHYYNINAPWGPPKKTNECAMFFFSIFSLRVCI